MRRELLRSVVSTIVIFGHLAVFLAGMALGIFSLLNRNDALQTVLMASPILAVIALAAFANIMENSSVSKDNISVKLMYSVVCIVFPTVLIAIILALFYIFYLQLDGFGPDQLKITLGGVETFFGVFIGAISKSLFGASQASSSSESPPSPSSSSSDGKSSISC